jgi:uncharacterized protein (DUF58 family)
MVLFAVAGLALLSANNLIYLVLSCLLSAMILSGLVSRLGLSGLQLSISFPQHLFARQRSLARVTVSNLKRWFPSFSIWIGAAPSTLPQDSVAMEEIYCPMVSGGSKAVASVPITFSRRGVFRRGTFWLRSRFPLSLVERRIQLELAREVLVYPSVQPPPQVEDVLKRFGRFSHSAARGDSHDLYRIRPALPDDSARFVDWKATARSRGLMVREFTRWDQREIDVVFDRTASGPNASARFEKLVQMCAAACWRLYGMQAEIRFLAEDVSILSSPNSAAIYEILRYLALAQPRIGTEGPAPWEAAGSGLPLGEHYRLIFTLRPAERLSRVQSTEGHYFLFSS